MVTMALWICEDNRDCYCEGVSRGGSQTRPLDSCRGGTLLSSRRSSLHMYSSSGTLCREMCRLCHILLFLNFFFVKVLLPLVK